MSNNDINLAGRVEICGAFVHVADLRKFTSDVRRFLMYLEPATALRAHEPGSAAWAAVVESVADPAKLGETAQELASICLALSEDMRKRKRQEVAS
jgi:hypothetical protein